LPPFLGVPLPIKDLVDVAGWPTTYGSAGASRVPKTTSDPVVQRFVDAGFVLLGKTTTSEFGAVPFTENEFLGISRNPWDPSRSPGGSSSGAGVAAASGMTPVAHAEDGGGSIRIPASCNGLVGLKATRGRIPGRTVVCEGFATSGVVTRSVADSAAVLDVLSRHDPAAWWSAPTVPFRTDPVRRLRIGVMPESPLAGIPVDPACRETVSLTLQAWESAGHHLVDVPLSLPPFDELLAAFTVIWHATAAVFPLDDPSRVEPHNRLARSSAHAVDSWAYVEAVQRTQQFSRQVTEAFIANFDLVVSPTMACLPPLIGSWDPSNPLLSSYPMGVFTALANITGQPAISVPVHQDPATGLPVGVQLTAAPWREDLLLQAAGTLELALPWAARTPPARSSR
jgi:amidase